MAVEVEGAHLQPARYTGCTSILPPKAASRAARAAAIVPSPAAAALGRAARAARVGGAWREERGDERR